MTLPVTVARRSPKYFIFLVIILSAILGYYVTASIQVSLARLPASRALFATLKTDRVQQSGDARPEADAAIALGADPLNQGLVNDFIVGRWQHGATEPSFADSTEVLGKLGWRHTPSVQNIVWQAANEGNFDLVFNGVDALMRRSQVVDQSYKMANVAAIDPVLRSMLVDRLANNPPWRFYYLQGANELKDPVEIRARAAVIAALQHRGAALKRNELAPLFPVMVKIGGAEQAFAIWRNFSGGQITSPLADTRLVNAALPLASSDLPVIFEWQLGAGPGYYVDSGRDQRGAFLSINWDGRGIPGLISQQTSGRSGTYRIFLAGDGNARLIASYIGFRFICSDGRVSEFTPLALDPRTATMLTASTTVACDFPVLELFGAVEGNHLAVNLVVRSISLARIG